MGYPAHTPAVAFYIGKFPVYIYALTMLSGILFSILTVTYFWRRMKYSWEHLEIITLLVVPSGIIGARIWFVLGNLSNSDVTSQWWAFWEGGLAIQGAVTASFIVGFLYVYKYRQTLDWRIIAGIIVPSVLIGQVIGRWGNFANHEVFGKIDPTGASSAWLGSWIHDNMYITFQGVTAYRVPLFFYESMINLIIYIVLVWVILYKGLLKPGVTASLYLMLYGIVRISMEPLRDTSDIMKWGTLDASVFFSGVFIFIGILSGVYTQFGTAKNLKKFKIKKLALKPPREYLRTQGKGFLGKYYTYEKKPTKKHYSKKQINSQF